METGLGLSWSGVKFWAKDRIKFIVRFGETGLGLKL